MANETIPFQIDESTAAFTGWPVGTLAKLVKVEPEYVRPPRCKRCALHMAANSDGTCEICAYVIDMEIKDNSTVDIKGWFAKGSGEINESNMGVGRPFEVA